GAAGTGLYYTNDDFRHLTIALQRCGTAGAVTVQVAYHYQRMLSREYATEEERKQAKRECDLQCANIVLAGLQKLGGIYVKLGQHISAMMYILPVEWTSTMAALQDRCEASSAQDIRELFSSDYGESLDDIFEEFDWRPLGVASLAQVHRARLRPLRDGTRLGNDGWVAVKLQHPRLDEFAKIDLATVTFIVTTIKRVFPDFGFEWIMHEMRESLPQEMDFRHEAKNAHQVARNFAAECKKGTTPLVIPEIIWARRRIMCMEFIEGARIDDLEYMKRHNIDAASVSKELSAIFSKMMFLDGFVHCDPHPGNVLIRPAKNPKHSSFNFDLVLLDHGLYRTLTDDLRTNYAHLWTSLIKGDEEGIRTYALLVGCKANTHRLFASLLTGREWQTIQSADLSSLRSDTEMERVSGRASGFLLKVADILATLPRVVLLLLKTSDLLRSLDETLRVSVGDHMTYIIMGRYCAKAVWLESKKRVLDMMSTTGVTWHLFKQLSNAWWEYHSLELGLWLYQL
ncbi:ABC1 family-domain-containing protein, partial [Radiomyces spectabilis]|uniref:ABC1 family-domain-containing protein n=1 Tax=Radiomyces spectabilis TaxID=64574 RepID=UPI00221F3E31